MPGRTPLPRGWASAVPSVEIQAAPWQVGGPDGRQLKPRLVYEGLESKPLERAGARGLGGGESGFRTEVKKVFPRASREEGEAKTTVIRHPGTGDC